MMQNHKWLATFTVVGMSNGAMAIFRSTREYIVGGSLFTRKPFPLTVSYAITVHKSEAATLDKALADILQKDFTTGLSYVAVLRVKALEGIVFEATFDLSDTPSGTVTKAEPRGIDRQRRLPQTL
ncbi:hypothetical protein NW759_016999 [Fusarium solani]|nr:hypothetical protein NW759_016999 [Fusarium solani]